MIEIVFGESACGSLKIAQTYGKGKIFLTTFTTTLHVSKRWALWVAMVPARAHSSNYCLD